MYTVRILKNADWFAPGTVMFDHAYGRHDPVKICLVCFLVQGNGHTIMIDTGMDDIDSTYTTEDRRKWDHLGASRNTGDLLREAGTSCEAVDTVILTHLHFDHYWNIRQFPNARIYAPRKDWFHVMDPANLPICPPQGFPREPLAYLAGEAFTRLKLVEDRETILPGITMHWTGGHSPGHMVVRVETSERPTIVVGDAFYLYENFEKNIPIGYCTDYREVLASYAWLRQQDAVLLPAHDYGIFDRHPTGLIGG